MMPRELSHFQNLKDFKLAPDARGRSALTVQLWYLVQATLFHGSPQILFGFRRWLLRLFGADIGMGVRIRSSATVTYPWKVKIGRYSWIGDEVVIYSLGPITIGENVVVSQRSYLCGGTHDYRSAAFDQINSPVDIEDNAWVATDVFVAPGVRIGSGAVVGSRSSVYSDLPAMMICVGSPARPVRPRFEDNG